MFPVTGAGSIGNVLTISTVSGRGTLSHLLPYCMSALDLVLTQMRQHAFNRLAPGATRPFSPFPRRPGQLYHVLTVYL